MVKNGGSYLANWQLTSLASYCGPRWPASYQFAHNLQKFTWHHHFQLHLFDKDLHYASVCYVMWQKHSSWINSSFVAILRQQRSVSLAFWLRLKHFSVSQCNISSAVLPQTEDVFLSHLFSYCCSLFCQQRQSTNHCCYPNMLLSNVCCGFFCLCWCMLQTSNMATWDETEHKGRVQQELCDANSVCCV